MKKFLINFIVITITVLCFNFSACNPKEQYIYEIGTVYESEMDGYVWEESVIIDEESERFIYTATYPENYPYTIFFNFMFYDSLYNNRYGKEEFIITDKDGNNLEFDEQGYVYFYSSYSINVYYGNALEEIKDLIKQDRYKIKFASKSYVPDVFNV